MVCQNFTAHRRWSRPPRGHRLLLDVSDNIKGKTFCPFGDAAVTPVESMIKLFRDDFEQHIVQRRCVAAA